MNEQQNRFYIPLIAAAALSVIAFGGIGVAAITGHLSIAHSNLNPFSGFSKAPASLVELSAASPSARHQGLTRHLDEPQVEGKPVDFQLGARVLRHKQACPDCGVVDSINPGRTGATTKLFDPSSAFTAQAGNILKTGTDSVTNAAPAGFVVRVNMENGTVRTIYEAERPTFSVGERIKLVNGAVIRIG
ncbi:MAG: hypothetical protein ABI771_08520 [Betaproteobacteria bacterium]